MVMSTMFASLYILIFAGPLQFSYSRVPYSMDSDDFYDSIRGDIESLWKRQRDHRLKLYDYMDQPATTTESINNLTTTQRNALYTINPAGVVQENNGNITMENLMWKMKNREVSLIMEQNYSPLISFANNIDETAAITRRFEQVYNKPRPILRETYWYDEERYWKPAKLRIIDTMAQFVYATRYRLQYSQVLRRKYMNDVKYKLGFCFALLRLLKQQQMILFEAMVRQYRKYPTGPYSHLRLYEKIVRLDVDIRDVIKMVKQLELQRKKIEFPDYYNFFPSSTGRAWLRAQEKS